MIHESKDKKGFICTCGKPVEYPMYVFAAVPLFESGEAASRHGKKDISKPKKKAIATMGKLLKKHKRLRDAT